MRENEREAQIQRALKALESGKYASLGEAVVAFNVPKSTLGHRKMGHQTRRKAHEKEQLLSSAAEEAIVKWILKLDDWRFPPRLDRLWEKVNVLAKGEERKRYGQATSALPPHIRQNWITVPQSAPWTCSTICSANQPSTSKLHANNLLTIKDHFRKLATLICTHIKPNAISNVDEKGTLLGQTAKAKMIGRRGKKNPYVKQHGSRKMVTLIGAVTASSFGLFGPLQHFYGIGIDEHFRDYGESFGFAPQHFLPIYLEARRKAYSLANIESAFRATGIIPLNSRILTKPRVNPEVQGELESVLLEKTLYTKCQLRQQTNAALTFVKTATPGTVCNLILCYGGNYK